MKKVDVTIAGRAYPLKVTDAEEDMVLQVADEINQKVRDFQKTYRNKDRQDCLSMALLTYALEFNKLKGQNDVLDKIKLKSADIQAVLEQFNVVVPGGLPAHMRQGCNRLVELGVNGYGLQISSFGSIKIAGKFTRCTQVEPERIFLRLSFDSSLEKFDRPVVIAGEAVNHTNGVNGR